MVLVFQPKSDIKTTNRSDEIYPSVFDGSERFIDTGIRLYGRKLFFEGSCSKIIDDKKKRAILTKLFNKLIPPLFNEVRYDSAIIEYQDALDYRMEEENVRK